MNNKYRVTILTCFIVFLSLIIFGLPTNSFAGAKACSGDNMCAKGEICGYGQCIPGCRVSTECRPGQYCINNECTDVICKPGSSRQCYEAGDETKSVGMCNSGIQFCLEDGKSYSLCTGQVLPQIEICDMQDNDCDGQIDNGVDCECKPGSKRTCYNGQQGTLDVGECKAGIQYCEMDNSWGKCLEVVNPSNEICDGKDNDCNGIIDDNDKCECPPAAIRWCYTHDPTTADVGECREGRQVCKADYTWASVCLGEIGPVKEIMADGKDNDCDGKVDNVFADPNEMILDKPVVIEPEPPLEIIE
ncbi:MAG TPA: MopE-related protein [Thermodesulfobacteriota bacterium]|nr:MopE-related protein [Thermodesulfobacteriota bacterium]